MIRKSNTLDFDLPQKDPILKSDTSPLLEPVKEIENNSKGETKAGNTNE